MRTSAPKEEPEILRLYEQARQEIQKFDPDLVIIFGTDHYAGFHLNLMPPYCVGLAASSVDDVGGYAGKLNVPEARARALVEHLYDEGFDPAVSHHMQVDHGFSQPLHRLLGSVDARPVIPVFINIMAEPTPRFKRSRHLGAALARGLAAPHERVLWIGSGGLSHHPERYYPNPAQAEPAVADWQWHGPQSEQVSTEQWFERLRLMHEEGAKMLADGRRTPKDIYLNPEFDQQFMNMMHELDLSSVDSWQLDEIRRVAGMGSLELQAWIAAAEGFRQMGGAKPHASLYVPTLEYGGGYGMVLAGGQTNVHDSNRIHSNHIHNTPQETLDALFQ